MFQSSTPHEFLIFAQVTKTICTETEEIVDNEVCAYSFTLVPVETEAKLVDVKWEKSCADDTVCLNPHQAPGRYVAPHPLCRGVQACLPAIPCTLPCHQGGDKLIELDQT